MLPSTLLFQRHFCWGNHCKKNNSCDTCWLLYFSPNLKITWKKTSQIKALIFFFLGLHFWYCWQCYWQVSQWNSQVSRSHVFSASSMRWGVHFCAMHFSYHVIWLAVAGRCCSSVWSLSHCHWGTLNKWSRSEGRPVRRPKPKETIIRHLEMSRCSHSLSLGLVPWEKRQYSCRCIQVERDNEHSCLSSLSTPAVGFLFLLS